MANPAPITLTPLKTIRSHAGIARFYAECDGTEAPDYIGTIPRQPIPSPYAYSPTHAVYSHHGQPVIVVETSHKVYAVFVVHGPLGPREEG